MDTYPLWLQDDSKLIGRAIDAYHDKCEAEGWTFDQPSHPSSGSCLRPWQGSWSLC